MARAEPSKVAIQLLQERSRDALIQSLESALAEMGHDELLAFLADLFLTMGADRDHLMGRLASLLAARFGPGSEKASPDQIELFAKAVRSLAMNETGLANPPSEETTPRPKLSAAQLIEQTNVDIDVLIAEQREARKLEREARRAASQLERTENADAVPWPKHLTVREEVAEIPEADVHCPDCGLKRRVFRQDKSWRLEYTTTVEVVVTLLPVAACASHHGGPVTTPVPPKPVDKGQMGFSLAARLLWLRATHNLPVRRIAEMMYTNGVPVSEQMIHTLISVSGERSKPLVAAIQEAVQAAALVNLDDTPTDVLDGHRNRKRRRARVWLALGDERFAYFFATKSWKSDEAEMALGAITGVLQGDGYRGFPKYARNHGITLAGCMAHLRRKLRKAVLARDPRSTLAMALVQGMYRVEELARLRGWDTDPIARLALRQERSVPLMQNLIAWAKDVEPTIVKGSPLGKAWTYLSNQLEPLQVFLGDGTVSIDNNAAERGLRRITIGRKLWLFFRGQAKLEHVSRLMSIVYTARLHKVDELAYLTWVLEELARREWSPAAAKQLLPAAWLAMQKHEAEEVDAGET
jgi:transposase